MTSLHFTSAYCSYGSLVIFYLLAASQLCALAGGQQGIAFRTDTVELAYDAWTQCPEFETALTNSGITNTIACRFQICPSDQINFRMCSNGGSCGGDSFLRLYDSSNNEVFSNDDQCGLCSGGTVFGSGESCGNFTLQQGCYSQGSCTGLVSIYRAEVFINPIPEAEVATLSELFDFTHGQYWFWPAGAIAWDFSTAAATDSICVPTARWYGVTCDCSRSNLNCYITGLQLQAIGLIGEISQVSFDSLIYLESLDFAVNILFGK